MDQLGEGAAVDTVATLRVSTKDIKAIRITLTVVEALLKMTRVVTLIADKEQTEEVEASIQDNHQVLIKIG